MKKLDHFYYMKKALSKAKVALKKGEVPVGAIVVDKSGEILSRAYNKIETLGSQSAHAEVLAIDKACRKKGTWRLDGCTLYVTLEPCLMCFGLIQLSRISALYFGASCKEFGSGLAEAKFKKIYRKGLKINGGINGEESEAILKKFFKYVREKKRKVKGEAKGKVPG